MDALLGEESRVHDDLDVVVALADVGQVLTALEPLGYRMALDDRPTRAVLADGNGHSVDLHPLTWDEHGTGWQAGAAPDGGPCSYPADGFTSGSVSGRVVRFLTAALQLAHHGSPPDAVDRSDVARLCARSGLAWPASYPTPFEDDDEPPEAPLPAGGLTPAVRVGETVRRGVGPWTPAVHALLDHLHQVGFVDAPRALGIDRRGREVLSFVTGEVGAAVRSPGRAGDEALVAVGRWLRRYHDAVSTFEPPPDASWQRLLGTPDGSVVGHGDISVANVVVGPHGGSVALIDWDLAVPSTALWDVAYAAWRLVPLVDDPDLAPIGWPAPVDRPMRLRLLVEAYGLDPADRRRLLEVVAQRQRSVTETIRAWGGEGVPGWRDLLERGVAEGPLRDIRFLEANRDEWRSAFV